MEIQTLFIESWCDDERIIEENVRRVKISSPDVRVATMEPRFYHVYSPLAVRRVVFRRRGQTLLDQDSCPYPPIPDYGGDGPQLHQGICSILHDAASLSLISHQMINAGERLIVNNKSFGYLSNRIVFYLLNLHIKSRHTYFARVSLPVATHIDGRSLSY